MKSSHALISELVSTLYSLQRLNHKAQLQQLHGLISSLLFTMLSVFSAALSMTHHPELVVHLYHIQIFCFRQFAIKRVVDFQYMHSWLGVKRQTRCQRYLLREREREKSRNFTNHCLSDSAVYMPFISRKGMSEWDDDSSKHFFLSFLYPSWCLFQHFAFIKASSQLLHPPMRPPIRAASDIHRRCPLQNIAPLTQFLIIIFSQASSTHA